MFISVLDLFKVGIGPSSSHTLGPMVAARDFITRIKGLNISQADLNAASIRCTLKGSLAYTGKGHATDHAVTLGLHGYLPPDLAGVDVANLIQRIWNMHCVPIDKLSTVSFDPDKHIIFDKGEPLPEHPNGLIFELIGQHHRQIYAETYFSIGGGFISTRADINQLQAPLKMEAYTSCHYPFDSAESMLQMANESGLSISQMKRMNELEHRHEKALLEGMEQIWHAMKSCIEKGLRAEGSLPGKLGIMRRAKALYEDLTRQPEHANIHDWLCAYAMAVNEENAAGHMVVTAPTNGAAGVIPAVLYYVVKHEHGRLDQVQEFLLTASAIGGLIKHRSSISGAEVGCQGEVGSAAAMAAAGLCAVRGGTPEQVEHAAEIALEHHLGMTCDPVHGLVQVPCIERNGFGAIKAFTAASLALRGSGEHFMPLDSCIEAMRQTGLEMSHKYKETSLGGLAVSITEC
ncbi:L-serine dehydratase [Mariprofundus micogutta]|uniref:L-serine dehydratase n=1 Tax=Mariprofundus micogutta TaxID=1921010 RepID=A0A1L8CKA4_9PROT|nr:L-serine ammonia-lyase [Mariprofundus micogutta]GAV19354.1 L-serine dehydratase [Mariprofundus micogutta]